MPMPIQIAGDNMFGLWSQYGKTIVVDHGQMIWDHLQHLIGYLYLDSSYPTAPNAELCNNQYNDRLEHSKQRFLAAVDMCD